ncbi:sensor histidine kinase [Roseateles amylovorans]|uniref:histidine kinase n=1 Tax=Roseateles amylovorans TaxID=2978473 RepID=A0ABY6B9T6_9BURK|nr:hypothetical protein [Roseateles amylovorans]UXH80330.1 hypothetical protein N4261_10825 [Roseateles amylovorans]
MSVPLTALSRLSKKLLADDSVGEAHRKSLTHIVRCSENLLVLISDLAELAGEKNWGVGLRPGPVRLRDLLSNTIEITRPLAEKKFIDLRLQISPSIPVMVQADEVRLRHVLLGLIAHGISISDHGPVRLDVRRKDDLLRSNPSTATVEFIVEDMSAKVEPCSFFSVDATPAAPYATERLIQDLGGQLHIVKEPELGCRLIFSIQLDMPWLANEPLREGHRVFSGARSENEVIPQRRRADTA